MKRICMAIFLLASSLAADAQYTAVISDNFTRANTSVGTVTGPTTYYSPSTGAAYVDVASKWSISSNTLIATGVANSSGSTPYLMRPTTENFLNGKAVSIGTASSDGGAIEACGRYSSGSGVAYCAAYYGVSGSGQLLLLKSTSSSSAFTVISSVNTSGIGAVPVVLTLTALGSSPTSLTATLALGSAPGTILYTATTSDSTSGLQASGQWGLSATGGTSGGQVSYTSFSTYSSTSSGPLAVGTLTATTTQNTITLTLSAALSNGSGTGYSYNVYRGTDPNFTANSASLIASGSSIMPYTDNSALPGVQYFYGVVGTDSASDTVYALPAGVGSWSPSYVPYVSANMGDLPTSAPGLLPPNQRNTPVCIVYVGDSITYGANVTNAGTMSSPTMPYFAITKTQALLGLANVYAANVGVSGSTLTDWGPTGSDYASAKAAMNALVAAHPGCMEFFSLMLGTNDSASTLTNNSPYSGSLTTAEYQAKFIALINEFLGDFPHMVMDIHEPPYYTPNTHNGAVYEQAGLSALFGYRYAISTVVRQFADTNPQQIFKGDTYAFQYFAANYAAELQADTSGPNGAFYLHPSGTAGTDGLIGTQSLGDLHGIADAWAISKASLVGSAPYF